MSGRDKFEKFEKLIIFFTYLMRLLPRPILIFLWDWTNRFSQLPFVGLRYVILKSMIKSCGVNIKIGTNVQILGWDNLVIGDNVSIHSNCYLDATGGIKIENNVSIAHNSTLLSTNHDWSDISIPIKYNKVIMKKVIINSDVWIGCGVRILAGVNIRERSVVAAGAVVISEVDSNTIVGGIPSRKLKEI
ncbi:MAG TPA: acyltransferase [Aequorivita sp.]|nr:acyltransferase [Aequorivita sp.]|tara:strand:- start:1233 stop:1799 length:567 start_codon:yes stop_codon:yes gene_type:complete